MSIFLLGLLVIMQKDAPAPSVYGIISRAIKLN